MKEAEEKAEQREKEKLERAMDKGKSKGKRKVGDASNLDGNSSVPTSSLVDSASRPQSAHRRSAVADTPTYEPLSEVLVLVLQEEEDASVDEFILNLSLDEILGGDSGILPPSNDELKAFLSKVSFFPMTE